MSGGATVPADLVRRIEDSFGVNFVILYGTTECSPLISQVRLDDSFAHYGASIDADSHSITLRKIQSRLWKSTFTFDRRGDDEMILNGDMDGHTIHVELQRMPMDVFRLTNGGFRWIRPPG